MPETAEPIYVQNKRKLMALRDEELIRELYDYAARAIPNEEGDLDLLDGMYWLIGEAIERWAPLAAWAERVQDLRQQGLEHEIHDSRLVWLETIGERMQLAEETAA